MEDRQRENYLDKAAKSLEHCFFLVAFASYVEEQTDFVESLEREVTFLRKTRGSRLNIFAPISELSSLAKTGSEGSLDEWTTHVVENRGGIVLRANSLLKSDQWLKESDPTENGIRGTINFRNVSGTKIYALGQPSLDAIDAVIAKVKFDHPMAKKIVWITLREEPIVHTLLPKARQIFNMKVRSPSSTPVTELNAFGGCLLLHTETAEGAVIPVWEQVEPDDVKVVKDIMASRKHIQGVELYHRRIPITSELPPDFSDFAELLDVVIRAGTEWPIVINCQLGRGRSTVASIILCMIQRWLQASYSQPHTPRTPKRNLLPTPLSTIQLEVAQEPLMHSYHSYKVINNVLRVVRRGLEVKAAVDMPIDQCARFFNLRDSIEDAALRAEETTDEHQRRTHVERGSNPSKERSPRLFITLQAYLDATPPDTVRDMETFESFVEHHPVFQTFEQEIFTDGFTR
ncbi:hypothetical protein JB92DRAFT_3128678 [Gautieria morchelliformis]|nr:hypothetical protein JB92DRAFT_3128678 [Gautieria morchelliformis]